MAPLLEASDRIMVTYYPLDGTFEPLGLETMRRDLQSLRDAYPSEALFFAEMGYPSGEALGSSEEEQAEGLEAAWQWARDDGNVDAMCMVWMHDLPEEVVATIAAQIGDPPGVRGFLSSLGLRTAEGEDKVAFTRFRTLLVQLPGSSIRIFG